MDLVRFTENLLDQSRGCYIDTLLHCFEKITMTIIWQTDEIIPN